MEKESKYFENWIFHNYILILIQNNARNWLIQKELVIEEVVFKKTMNIVEFYNLYSAQLLEIF